MLCGVSWLVFICWIGSGRFFHSWVRRFFFFSLVCNLSDCGSSTLTILPSSCFLVRSVTLCFLKKWGVKCASTHELVTKNALLRVMSMAEWQDEEGEEDAKSKDWSTAANEKRGFEHPMASAAISLFNSTVLDKNGGEAWAEQGGGGWNDDFIGQQPTERLLGIQLDSQAILMLLLPLKASDPVLYR